MDKAAQFLADMQHAGTLTQKEKIELMQEVDIIINESYQPITELFGVDDKVAMILHRMVSESLKPYVSYHNYNEAKSHDYKQYIGRSDIFINKIAGYWDVIFNEAAKIANKVSSEFEAKKLLNAVETIFSEVSKVIIREAPKFKVGERRQFSNSDYTGHNWNLNIYLPEINKGIELLKIRYNTEVYKLIESKKQQTNQSSKSVTNKASGTSTPPLKNIDKGFTLDSTIKNRYLKELHGSLVYIACINCNWKNFKSLFQGKEILAQNKVEWLGSAFELRKFINQIHNVEIDNKSIVTKEVEHWKTAFNCFFGTNKSGKPFDIISVAKARVNKNDKSNRIIRACDNMRIPTSNNLLKNNYQ